ncbi:MAG TPA: glycosyltransferase family 2 protein [Gemmatimonadaceae bacterium]
MRENRQPLPRSISVVTPTLDRPDEVRQLLQNLSTQRHLPLEIILVDGGPPEMRETERVVRAVMDTLPFRCVYIRHGGGTAIQRNVGIDVAQGEFIAFIDDDMLLEPDFFEIILDQFAQDTTGRVGAVAGYITNQYLDPAKSPRWQWYRRLGLFTTYEPGRFDFETGYPINRYMQPPHDGVREIDITGTNCAVWRSEVFASGLRLSPFFVGFGVVEDAHLALCARRQWTIWECGRAHCVHMHSPRGRTDKRRVARKTAVNYRFLFVDIVRERTLRQEFRFWRVQFVDLVRQAAYAIRHGSAEEWSAVLGKIEGIIAATRVKASPATPS